MANDGQSRRSAAGSALFGARRSSTMMVMMTAMTPSENASKRALENEAWVLDIDREALEVRLRGPGGLGGATLPLRPIASRCAPLRRRGPLPGVKGAHERIDLLEAEHEGDLAHREVRVREEPARGSP